MEITTMPRMRSRAFLSTVLATGILLMAFALPAGASGKTASFCKDVQGVAVVLSPTLPANDSLDAIAAAVAKLPSDATALKKIHAKLIAVVAVAPGPTLAGVYRDAAASVVREVTALSAASNQESALLADPKNSAAVLTLAKDLIAAFSAAAAANTYLTVDRSLVGEACRNVT
jgi:hypothetical protein